MTKVDYDFPNSDKINQLSLPAVALFNSRNSTRAIGPLLHVPQKARKAYKPALDLFIRSSERSEAFGLGKEIDLQETKADSTNAHSAGIKARQLFLKTHIRSVGQPKEDSSYAAFHASVRTFEICAKLLYEIVVERSKSGHGKARSRIYDGCRTLAKSANEACYKFEGTEALNAAKRSMSEDVVEFEKRLAQFQSGVHTRISNNASDIIDLPSLWHEPQPWFEKATMKFIESEPDVQFRKRIAQLSQRPIEEFDFAPNSTSQLLLDDITKHNEVPISATLETHLPSRLDVAITELMSYYRPMSLVRSFGLILAGAASGLIIGSTHMIDKPELTCLLGSAIACGIGLRLHTNRMQCLESVLNDPKATGGVLQ